MNNQAKLKLEKIKKLKLPEKVRATADKIEKGLSSADEATQKKAEDALNKLYDQIKAVAAKKREEKTEKEVNEKTIVPQNADIAAPEEKKELTKKATVADDIIDKALKSDPELKGFGKSDKRRDAGRKALPAGRRVSRKGWKNQYGKSDGGRVYYEGRENRTDRKSPSFKSGYPYLAKGGKIHRMDEEDGTFYVNHYKTKGDQMSSVDEREYKSKASAMTYAMMKSNFLKVGESIFVMNDDGDVLYTSIGTKKMAMGGKFAYQDAQVGDSARVILENKMGTIVVAYGRRFHLKFPDGTEKTYSAEELEFYPDEELASGGIMAKGGIVVTSIKDIPNFEERLNQGRITYRGLGVGKLSNDFFNVAGEGGVMIKVDGKEYYITDTEFNSFSRDAEGILRVKFSAPKRKFAKGGYMADGGEVETILAVPKYMRDEIEESINLGYDELVVGMISKNRKGVLLVNDNYEVRGTYDMALKKYIENIIANHKKTKSKGGYVADGENYEYVNTFKRFDSNVPVPQEDFEKLVDAYHKQLSGDKLAVSKYKVLKLKMGNYLGHKTVEEMEAYIEKTHNAHKMAKGGMMDNGVDYVELINLIKSADNPRNLPIYYNSDSNVVNVGGVGYDKGELVKKFNARAGQSLEIKNLFYQANQYPQETKNRIESMNVGIEVEIGKGYGNETFVKYIKMRKGGYMADGGVTSKLTYIPRRQIKLIIIKNPNKKGTRNYLMIDKKDFLDGLYLEKGGKIDKAYYTYIPRTGVNQVVTTQNKIYSNPKNGFWVLNEALNKAGRNLEKTFKKDDVVYNKETNTIGIVRSDSYGDGTTNTDSDGVVSTDILTKFNGLTHATASIAPSTLKEITDRKLVDEGEIKPKNTPNKSLFNKTYLRKSKVLGWTADTYTDGKHYGFDWKISTYKRGDYLTSVVQAGKDENGIWSFILFQDPKIVLIREYSKRATEKSVGEQQEKALKMFEEKLADGTVKAKVDSKMAKGGKIGFEALSKKVASRYAGKKVQPKYQDEYGKTYNAEEAKEVGDKVAAKVYRMQQGKMAKGGKIDLPYELDRYFTKPKGTIEVEISKLIPIRARESGIEKAEVYMKKAYDGEMAKRKPIEIYKTRNKKYRINDGNSTYAVAKKNGWETIYATVVSNPNVKARVEKSTFTIAKEIRKEGESWADTLQRVKNMRK